MQLESCPFCGGEPEIIRTSVHCNNPMCEAQPFTAGQSVAEAIAAWHRRTPSPGHASLSASDEREVRMLTREEVASVFDPNRGARENDEALQRKFCEVNGIRLSSDGAASVLSIQGDANA